MAMRRHIDITFDFRSDTPRGKDPDSRSPPLRSYHKLLWSKPLPSGVVFELHDTTRNRTAAIWALLSPSVGLIWSYSR